MGSSTEQTGKPDPTTNLDGGLNLENKNGIIRYATVVVSEPGNNRISVQEGTGPHPLRKYEARYLPAVFSAMFGFRQHYLPPVGTPVVILNDPESASDPLVIGALSGSIHGSFRKHTTVADGGNYAGLPHNNRIDLHAKDIISETAPIDLIEGEYCIENDMGVMIALLTNLCKLQAGDRAKLEMSALNDLVRIVSMNFQHESALGQHWIRNAQGKVWSEWHASTNFYETFGATDIKEAYMGTDLDKKDFDPEENEKAKQEGLDGRWHFSLYTGWLGDFVNLFFSDPPKGISILTGTPIGSDQTRSGKHRLAVGEDGSFLVQSVSDIVLERVVRIPVPIRARDHWDPEGDVLFPPELNEPSEETEEGVESITKNTFDPPLCDEWTPTSADTLHEAVYQLRHYARWLNQMYTMRKFRGMKNTFVVPSEAELDPPNVPHYAESYSTIRIFRDGSQLLLDAYNNSIVMTKEGITISSVNNLRLEALNNVYISAGSRISVFAKQTISITSALKHIKMKARDGLCHLLGNAEMVLRHVDPNEVYKLNLWGWAEFTGALWAKLVALTDYISAPMSKIETPTELETQTEASGPNNEFLVPSTSDDITIDPTDIADPEDPDSTPHYASYAAMAVKEAGLANPVEPGEWVDGPDTQSSFSPGDTTPLSGINGDPTIYEGKATSPTSEPKTV
jgi:hypothetical protein